MQILEEFPDERLGPLVKPHSQAQTHLRIFKGIWGGNEDPDSNLQISGPMSEGGTGTWPLTKKHTTCELVKLRDCHVSSVVLAP